MRITPRVCTSVLSFLIATDTCESANWSLFGAERWLLSELSLYYECMEVIRGHLGCPLSGGCPLFGGFAIGGSTVLPIDDLS